MKKQLLRTMLLLFALVAGGQSVWAVDLITWTARTSGSGADSYTEGYTYANNKISGKAGYVQDSGTADETIVSMSLYKEDSKLFATTPVEITFSAKLGGGSVKDPLDYNIYACFVDNTGADIADSEVTVTTKITNKDGSDFSVNMPTAKAADAYGIKIYHKKESGWNARYYNFTLSYSNVASATWTLSPASAIVTAGESAILDLTTNYDGTLNFASADESIATVSYNSSTKEITINGIARGTTTINVTGDATANYKAISKTINVVVRKVLAANCLMYDSFDSNAEEGGNDGTWKNISSTPTPIFDLTGWTYDTAYGASTCVRIGGGGYFLSPALGVSGNVTLKIKVESWGTDGSTGYVDIVGGGTFDDSESITGVSFAEENTRAQVTLAKTGTWTEYTLKINGVTASSKIKLLGPGTKRIFFDEFEVLLDKVNATITAAGYATFVAPVAVDFSATSLEVYTAQVNGAKNGVVLNEVASKKVPANTAVILKGETAAGAVIATADALEDNDLVAGPVTGDGVSYYALGKEGEKVGFGILADGTELPANKAYIAASKFGASAPAFMPFSFGETTGISEKVIVNSEKFATAPVYNLNGQRVMNPTKGLYIVNGRKVAIK